MQNLALTPMRFEARTTAGAQTTSEAKPRRNCRRGTISEPIFRNPQRLLMNTRRQLHSVNADTDDRRTVLDPPPLILAAMSGFVDIPNRGSSEQRS